MDNIIKKEYEWGKAARNQNLIAGIIFGILTLGALGLFLIAGETTPGGVFMSVIFLLGTILGFVQYFFMTKNKIFIQVTDYGINISPIFMDFVFSPKVIKWEDISKIEIKAFGKSRKIILSLLTGMDIKIKLGFLNKDDQESLLQSIKKVIEKESTA